MVTYSISEARAKFTEVIRRVRAGQPVLITYRGEEVAEIRPIEAGGTGLEKSLARLEDEGVLSRARKASGRLRPLARRRGVLTRFLKSRE